MAPTPDPQAEPRISITYAPVIDPSRDLYDGDTIVITVLDEDFEDHQGRGVPVIALEKGRHEYPAWIHPLIQKHCAELLTDGRMHIEAVAMPVVEVAQVTNWEKPPQISVPIPAHNLPYAGTAFKDVTTPVSQLNSLMLVSEELRMDAIGLLCTELEGAALLQQLKRWGRDPYQKPGVKTRLTKLIRKLEAEDA